MLSSILWWRKIITYLSKPKRTRIQHDSSELESNEGEWEEDEFSSLDTADEDADRDDGDVENRIISEKVLSVWSKILPSVQEKEILGKRFAGIYETKNNKRLCIECLFKRWKLRRKLRRVILSQFRWGVLSQKLVVAQWWKTQFTISMTF